MYNLEFIMLLLGQRKKIKLARFTPVYQALTDSDGQQEGVRYKSKIKT